MKILLMMLCFLILNSSVYADEFKLPQDGALDKMQSDFVIEKNLAYIIDVRTKSEFKRGHLEKATLIPIQELEKRLDEIPKGKQIMFVCRTGGRACSAYELFKSKRPDAKAWYVKATLSYPVIKE